MQGIAVQEEDRTVKDKGLARVTPEEHEESQSTLFRVRRRPTPFTKEIIVEELPSNFHSLCLGEYDGSTDLKSIYASLKT